MVPVERPKTNEKFEKILEKIHKWKTALAWPFLKYFTISDNYANYPHYDVTFGMTF
jgi:hypothetical protein